MLRPPSTPGPPDLFIGPLSRGRNHPCPFTVSRLHNLHPVHFQTAPRKHLYTLVLHTLHFLTLASRPDTKWQDLLPPLEGEEPQWASLYSTFVLRPAGDISWWLLHRAVSTGVYLAWFTPVPDTCPFCGEGDPGARLLGLRQFAAPIQAPHKYFVTLLVTLLPSPPYLCTPYPWPHKAAGPPGLPPPGPG
ncbi:unnamed protein product [Natator depressus]